MSPAEQSLPAALPLKSLQSSEGAQNPGAFGSTSMVVKVFFGFCSRLKWANWAFGGAGLSLHARSSVPGTSERLHGLRTGGLRPLNLRVQQVLFLQSAPGREFPGSLWASLT